MTMGDGGNTAGAPQMASPAADRLGKALGRVRDEAGRELQALRARPDRLPAYDYFLDLLAGGVRPDALERRTGKPALNLLCIQAPLELAHAAGFLPFKIFSGSYAADAVGASGRLPALVCPMLRAVQGVVRLGGGEGRAGDGGNPFLRRPWVLPTTCDWIVKLPEMLRLGSPDLAPGLHWLELPHLKDAEPGRRRWLEEVFGFKAFLEDAAGVKIDRKRLAASMAVYGRAWAAFARLGERRRAGDVPFAWFLAVANSFFLDAPERWTEAVGALLDVLPRARGADAAAGRRAGRVFFAGSPVFFPNFKLPGLLEEAGLAVVGDDLCSSGRVIPPHGPDGVGAGTSEYELVAALAERYHQGCLCPTFADNDRRVHGIFGALDGGGGRRFDGVVFHVLKGCHPYDLESCALEAPVKAKGLKFLRVETDYAAEDARNLLTRLEAFRQTLG